MSIVLFALIGATIKAGAAYWICFSIHCVLEVVAVTLKIINAFLEN